MSMEIVYVSAYVRTYVRPRPTATLRMRERCSNSADLAGFRNQLFVSVQEMSQTQQESDRQKRLERRRQQDRDKRARETPDDG